MLKELRESRAELRYIDKMTYFEKGKVLPLIEESSELIAIFTATTKKVKEKLDNEKK